MLEKQINKFMRRGMGVGQPAAGSTMHTMHVYYVGLCLAKVMPDEMTSKMENIENYHFSFAPSTSHLVSALAPRQCHHCDSRYFIE